MKKKKVSQFEKWFRAQFGSMPEDFDLVKLERDLEKARYEVAKIEGEIALARLVAAEYRAASYARYAAEKGFKT